MSRSASPFSPRALLAILAVGASAFLLMLYAIGAGWTGGSDRNGGAHAAANGLNGFAGLVRLLEDQGHDVSISRSAARLDEEALLVITPQHFADGEELWSLLVERRYQGPTLLILPKWFAMMANGQQGAESARPGWVMLLGAESPEWPEDMGSLDALDPKIVEARRWLGFGLSGALPDAGQVQAATDGLVPLVKDSAGRILAGYRDDNGVYPVLAEAAGVTPSDSEAPGTDNDAWPLVVVMEPDLLNNYGLADRERAELAHAIVDAAIEDYELPVVFDLTVAGLGQSENLLTLAFRPPFLAATLCLLMALVVVGWRAFGRFGPPLAEGRAIAFGKARLAANAGGFLRRSGRLHLLGPPYAELVGRRLAAMLGLRRADAQAIDAALARRLPDGPTYSDLARRLETARGPSQTLRAAHALKSLERTLTP